MAGEYAEYPLERATIEDQEPVETLSSHGPDPALDVSVRVRNTGWGGRSLAMHGDFPLNR
jgi:hypothetical protein